ncbi:MAG: hypothetical protein ACOY93_09780 [Bacillota bacterium]
MKTKKKGKPTNPPGPLPEKVRPRPSKPVKMRVAALGAGLVALLSLLLGPRRWSRIPWRGGRI